MRSTDFRYFLFLDVRTDTVRQKSSEKGRPMDRMFAIHALVLVLKISWYVFITIDARPHTLISELKWWLLFLDLCIYL